MRPEQCQHLRARTGHRRREPAPARRRPRHGDRGLRALPLLPQPRRPADRPHPGQLPILGAAATAAQATAPANNERAQWLSVCASVRDWAVANPTEYGLLYGSPIPGYDAPKDAVGPAATVVMLLAGIAAHAATADRLHPAPLPTPLPAPVRADLRTLIEQQSSDLHEEVLDRVFLAWTQLFGLITFEIFGRLDGTIEAVADYFTHHMNLMADLVGLPAES
ncbi:TetR-like C-terminal domain-containing protein [Nocardia sp. NPDC059091]|uniref:TetR-like C-terminal domain-containing protein n=1 Tax=Nocardia sp. NPDC059091 TaxID=3346724 RepID=UPI0036B65CC2